MTQPAVVLDAVSKAYPAWAGQGRTLRSVAARRMPLRHRRGPQRLAVRDVSLSINPGEAVGLIGGNGAGKSTLLRIASGLTRATEGRVKVPVGTAAVLSLGEAFSLELTGEENALTTAIVAGFSPKQAKSLLPEIIAFAELEDAAHAPVRTYSEGMKLRLAFAVVAQSTPPALLLDEVMSVGDVSFQQKSKTHITSARDQGTAVLLASHDLGRMVEECTRIAWLDQGRVRMMGDPAEVVAAYEHEMMEETYRRSPAAIPGVSDGRVGSREVTIDDVKLHAPGGDPGLGQIAIMPGRPLTVSWTLSAHTPPEMAPIIAVVIRDESGATCCSLTTERDGRSLPRDAAAVPMHVSFDRLDLVPGKYEVEIGAYRGDWKYAFDLHADGYPFTVLGAPVPHGFLNPPRTWD